MATQPLLDLDRELNNYHHHHQPIYRMGIDIGSVSAKVVVLDPQAEILFSDYRRHRAETWATIYAIIQEALQTLGDVPVSLMITGSAGMGVSERYGIPFIQEVIASAEVIKQLYPQVRTLIDIGGEDAKLIFFDDEGVPDIRMNGSCAGGTGAYIDEMATLLNVSVGRSERSWPTNILRFTQWLRDAGCSARRMCRTCSAGR